MQRKQKPSRTREALKFRLASKYVAKKMMAAKSQPSKSKRAYQADDD